MSITLYMYTIFVKKNIMFAFLLHMFNRDFWNKSAKLFLEMLFDYGYIFLGLYTIFYILGYEILNI